MSAAVTPRLRESPTGGSRIAYSYLGVVLALVVAGVVSTIWGLFTDRVCGPDMDIACGLGWWWLGGLVGYALGTALTAWAFRLGWEWWVVVLAGILALPAVTALPSPAVLVWAVAIPALAGAATWSGDHRPRWRPLLTVGLLVLALAASAVSVFVP